MMGATASPVLSGNMMNDSLPKDESEQLLQDLIMEMSDQDYDSIKFASYRTAAKLLFIQKKANLHLVDVYNMIEAFRENGLNTLDHNTELHESRLEAIVSSIFYALNKRLPTTHNVDVERSISTVTNWLLYAYDSDAIGRIRVLSVKTALSTLCAGRLVDKLRYHFSQVEDDNGLLNFPKFEAYLRELLQLPAAVGEGPTFGFAEEVPNMFFQPNGPLKRQQTVRINFLECVMSKDAPPCYVWLTTMQKMVNALKSQHLIACDVCKRKPLVGLRYKCLHCYNYTLCQDCFWRGKVSNKHKVAHDVREYTTWNTGERGSSFRSKLLCAGGRKKKKSLPDFPNDPEPNKTLDVTNIVPPLPSDMSGRNNSASDYASLLPADSTEASITSSSPTKFMDDLDSRMDDEHKLISRYAARLAANARQKSPSVSASQSSLDVNREQRELMQTLENKNRLLLKEIRRLREEHEQATRSVAQISQNPQLLAELKLLRQRKDELELRMSALQESRRELMVQLEGLMNLLKTGPPRAPRSPKSQRMADNSASETLSKSAASPTLNGAPEDPSQLNGVDGDIKQAFGNKVASKNLRDDLLMAADNVTNAMFSLVKELNSDDDISAKPDLGFINGDSDTADLEALERQVNQIRQSLGANEEMGQGHMNFPNGDVTMTDVSGKVISHGREKKGAPGRLGLGRLGNRRADGERTDTDTDDDEILVRNGNYKYPSVRTPMTDDESYIQTDDDEGTGRTDDEDQEWQDSMRRWANR